MSDTDESVGETVSGAGPLRTDSDRDDRPASEGRQSRLGRFETSRWFCMLLGLCIGLDVLLHIATIGVGPAPVVMDAREYWKMGGQVADGDFWLETDARPYRTPLYPLFLGLFQKLFAEQALFATIVAQHILVWATSLLAGWMSVRLSGRRAAFLLGYALSAMCLTRTWYANTILSESLFVFLLTLTLIALVAWLRRPSTGGVVVLGILLGLTILTRAAAQLVGVPLLGLIWFRGGRNGAARGKVGGVRQVCWFVATLGVFLVPWVVRNQFLFGETFLARNYPRSRWNVCFQGGSAAGLPIPNDESGTRLLEVLGLPREEVEGQHVSFVEERLREAGFSQEEMNDLFRAVCRRGIRENPGMFGGAAAKRFVNYWRCTVKEYPFFTERTVNQVPPGSADYPRGQRLWRWDGLSRISEPLLRGVPFLSLRWNEVIAAATFLGLLLMFLDRATRYQALGIGLTFLYFNAVTAVVVIENYRYRMILEPAMAAIITYGVFRVIEKSSRSDDSVRETAST